jgi:hypothetical protein
LRSWSWYLWEKSLSKQRQKLNSYHRMTTMTTRMTTMTMTMIMRKKKNKTTRLKKKMMRTTVL